MNWHRNSVLHFSGYFPMVLSGFFLQSRILTSWGNRNILELDFLELDYRDSTIVGEGVIKKGILKWKYPEDNYFILEGGCFFLILNKHNYSSHGLLKMYSLLLK